MVKVGKCVTWNVKDTCGVVLFPDGSTLNVHFSEIEGKPRLYVGEKVLLDQDGKLTILWLDSYLSAVKKMQRCLHDFHVAKIGSDTSAYIKSAELARRQMYAVDELRGRLHPRRLSEKWLSKGLKDFFGPGINLTGYKHLEAMYQEGPQKVLNSIVLGFKVTAPDPEKVKVKFHVIKFLDKIRRVITNPNVNVTTLRKQYERLIGYQDLKDVDEDELREILDLMIQVCTSKATQRKLKKQQKNEFNSLRNEIEQYLKTLSQEKQ